MRMRFIVGLLFGALSAGCTSEPPAPAAQEAEAFGEVDAVVESPDGMLRFEIGRDAADRPRYRIVRVGMGNDAASEEFVVIGDSTLGLELTDESGRPISIADGVSVEAIGAPATTTDAFDLPTGKARSAAIEATTQSIRIVGDDASISVDVWVSNTAAAFRYNLAAEDVAGPVRVEWERTSYAINPDALVWLQPHDAPGYATPAYEKPRDRATQAANPGRSANGWTFPLLSSEGLSSEGLSSEGSMWTLITESALGEGDAGSHLSGVVADGEFFVEFAGRGEGNGVGDPRPLVALPWTSPWRIIITSTDVGDIVESDVVRHLSPPTDPQADFSWVRPGRVSWSWLTDHESSTNADSMERFVDLAAEMGWEYSLVDANWNTIEERRFQDLIDHAAGRNVGLLLWYNSGGPGNIVTEQPRDLMFDRAVRRAEMERISKLGIAGIKVDFFHSDKPVAIDQYRAILEDAADFELLVDFHGSTLPRGWSRKFPNLMTMEAVRGAEIYTFDASYAALAPWQNTVLPFTRNVVGSMDYTPVLLGDAVLRRTTNGHELALAVVFESALQHFADTPEAYLGQPAEVIDLLSAVPSVWDETRFISGVPGTHVVIARRDGDDWWIGAINGTDQTIDARVDPRVDLDLDGGDSSADLRAVQVCDNPSWDNDPGRQATWDDPSQYRITTPGVDGVLPLELVPNGGCLVRITGS